MKGNSIGRTGKHSEFCEGHVTCPETKKEECGKELNTKFYADGHCECVTVFCFGCGNPHQVREEMKRMANKKGKHYREKAAPDEDEAWFVTASRLAEQK